jgi:hypothetical protein
MAQVQIAAGSGLRNVRTYLLNSNGFPSDDESGANGYDGELIDKARSFTSNVPDSQTITHTGNDRAFAMDVLPPTELETANLTTGVTNLGVDATLSATKVEDLGGDVVMGLMSTDKQGQEPQVMVMGWRQALSAGDCTSGTKGQRRYITNMYPSARVVPKAGDMEQGSDDENSYNVVPTVVCETPWGVAFSEANNGATEAQRLRLISDNPLMYESFVGDGTLDTFTLTKTPITTVKTRVWDDGTPATVNSVDTVAKTFTLSAIPANASEIGVLYETTETS